MYGCQVWATFSLTYDSSVTTRAHVLHLGFLKKLLGVKKGTTFTDTHCVLRETGQMPIFFYWFRCTIRFWNNLLSSNNPLLEKIVRAGLLLANRSDTWTYQVLHALQDLPTSRQLLDAIRSRQTINLGQFELTLRERIIGGWRDLDILTPHEAHHSSKIMRTYHTHFGVPLGNTSGWWDDRKRNQKPVLPLYLRLDIPSNLSRALSCLHLSGHNFLVQRMRHDRNRRPYELRICDRCDWHTIQDEEHILLDCLHEHLVRLRTQQQLIFPHVLRNFSRFRLRAHHLRVESCKWHGGSSICDKCECGEVQDDFFCKCAEVCELRMRYRDLFEEMFKTLHAFAPSSSEFIPFLACLKFFWLTGWLLAGWLNFFWLV